MNYKVFMWIGNISIFIGIVTIILVISNKAYILDVNKEVIENTTRIASIEKEIKAVRGEHTDRLKTAQELLAEVKTLAEKLKQNLDKSKLRTDER